MCKGDTITKDIKTKQIAKIRTKEDAKNSVKTINVQSKSLAIFDENLYPDCLTRKIFIDIIRDISPDIAINHFFEGYMHDHINIIKLVLMHLFDH